ncbi:MAG: branched-chain amino acid ABC transporter permease, partial [Oscillospiraceae bacterium]
MSLVINQLINGLQSGSVYALIALGYSMVYGIIMLLNFAHGDVIMVGAYVAWLAMTRLALNPIIAIILAIVACTLLGVVIEKVAYTPLRSSPRISLLITAIGISFLLENLAQLIFGAGSVRVPPIISGPALEIGGQHISFTAMITIVVSIVSMIALTFLVKKTKMGKAMRAVSEDMGAAQLMGISVNRTISFTFAV